MQLFLSTHGICIEDRRQPVSTPRLVGIYLQEFNLEQALGSLMIDQNYYPNVITIALRLTRKQREGQNSILTSLFLRPSSTPSLRLNNSDV